MLGTYYYHEIIRKTIISFGTLFNTIDIKHKDQTGKNYSTVRIPVAYGPAEKFLARLEQKPDIRKRVAITLPRIAFELYQLHMITLERFLQCRPSKQLPKMEVKQQEKSLCQSLHLI